MKHDHQHKPVNHKQVREPSHGSEIRSFAGWMGLVLIAFGVAIAGYLLLRIGEVVLDPRSFETQVDRWEFVVRGRVSDALPEQYETPSARAALLTADDPTTQSQRPANSSQDVEKMAEFVGRVASKSARPAALFLIVIILTLIVRIIIAIIHAGIRLVYVTAGEKEYMKQIIDELVEQRRQ